MKTTELELDSITPELAEKVVEYWKNKAKKKTYELEDENLRVEPEYVDDVTVFEKDGEQYFTFDAAQIHAKRLGKKFPTKEQWETILKEYSLEELKRMLPLSGYHSNSSDAYYNQRTFGYYWASSPPGTYGYVVYLSATKVSPANSDYRAFGFSVRCLKNS